MNADDLDLRLRGANPFPRDAVAALDLGSAGAALVEGIAAEPASADGVGAGGVAGARSRPWRRRTVLAAAGALVATAAAVALMLSAGGGETGPNRAYAAALVRFAEASPLLLLEGPGWRVQDVTQWRSREGIEGSMEFVTGKPVPYESVRITGSSKAERESGMLPPQVRQRQVELSWHHGNLAATISTQRRHSLHPHGQRWLKLPVLGTTAAVDTRAEFYVNQGGPGNRRMVAFWSAGGYVLQLAAAVPDLAAFEERLAWLTKVDTQTWLDAMPAKVVKAADHDAVVREILQDIPVPKTFSPSKVPDEGLTTNRYQVGADVTATVSCLWFLQWGEARRSGDQATEREAERAMATSRRWKILREMTGDGAYPEAIWKLAAEMPSGYREYAGHKWRLLPQAEALGCARLGLPLLAEKQKRQREHGPPPPPD
jgi:hypothetical protein